MKRQSLSFLWSVVVVLFLHHCNLPLKKSRVGVDAFTIERVSSRSRVLDLMVFRNWSKSLKEYLSELDMSGNGISVPNEEQALSMLTKRYDNRGRSLDDGDKASGLVQFVAIVSDSRSDEDESLRRTGGVVGAVDVRGSRDTGMAIVEPGTTTANAHAFVFELRRLHVDERFRRQGIASALVEAVQHHARCQRGDDDETKPRVVVFLDHELDNVVGKQLYVSRGFRTDPEIETRMLWYG